MDAPKRRRRKGSGSEYIDAQGRYVIEKKVLTPEGRKSQVRGYGASWAEAQARFDKNHTALLRGGGRKQSQKSLRDALAAWEASTASGQQTKYRTRLSIENHFISKRGNSQLVTITKSQIQKALEAIPEEQPGARRNFLKDVKKILNDAIKRGWITDNPAQYITLGMYEAKNAELDAQEMVPRVNEFRKLLKWLREAERWEFYPLLFMTLGLRISELLGLEWDSVQSRPGGVTVLRVDRQLSADYPQKIVKRVKGKFNRELHLPDFYISAFAEWKFHPLTAGEPKQEWAKEQVFTRRNSRGERVGQRQDDYRKFLTELLQEHHRESMIPEYGADVKPVEFTAHFTRKMTATMLAQEGVSMLVAQNILGHMTKEMTEHYTHVLDGQKAAGSAAIHTAFFNFDNGDGPERRAQSGANAHE